MSEPTPAPSATYEKLQHTAIDYLDHLCKLFRTLKRHEDESLQWQDVHAMTDLISTLANAARLIGTMERVSKTE